MGRSEVITWQCSATNLRYCHLDWDVPGRSREFPVREVLLDTDFEIFDGGVLLLDSLRL